MGETQLERTEALRARTKAFALRLIRLVGSLPHSEAARVLSRQVLRSGTSVAANYRAASRARSVAEFTAKLGVVVEEADETVFWLELLTESGLIAPERIADLLDEARQLTAIFTAARATARRRTS